jgi:PAS domain S-box-containing protein
MAKKITPIDREVIVPENELLVSKTDPQGNITYCNRAFMRIAGYSEKQLINSQHNIIRHPDMPRGVYRHMWQTLDEGREYFGYLKNMNNSGAYYWLFIHIAPSHVQGGKLHGYYSVRRKALPHAIATIEPIYKEMLAIEQLGDRTKGPERSIAQMHQRMNERSANYEHFVLNI